MPDEVATILDELDETRMIDKVAPIPDPSVNELMKIISSLDASVAQAQVLLYELAEDDTTLLFRTHRDMAVYYALEEIQNNVRDFIYKR